MKNRVYTSFEEIDRDLTILDLRRQIALEECKADLRHAREQVTPSGLLESFGGDALKRMLFTWLLGFLLKKFRK